MAARTTTGQQKRIQLRMSLDAQDEEGFDFDDSCTLYSVGSTISSVTMFSAAATDHHTINSSSVDSSLYSSQRDRHTSSNPSSGQSSSIARAAAAQTGGSGVGGTRTYSSIPQTTAPGFPYPLPSSSNARSRSSPTPPVATDLGLKNLQSLDRFSSHSPTRGGHRSSPPADRFSSSHSPTRGGQRPSVVADRLSSLSPTRGGQRSSVAADRFSSSHSPTRGGQRSVAASSVDRFASSHSPMRGGGQRSVITPSSVDRFNASSSTDGGILGTSLSGSNSSLKTGGGGGVDTIPSAPRRSEDTRPAMPVRGASLSSVDDSISIISAEESECSYKTPVNNQTRIFKNNIHERSRSSPPRRPAPQLQPHLRTNASSNSNRPSSSSSSRRPAPPKASRSYTKGGLPSPAMPAIEEFRQQCFTNPNLVMVDGNACDLSNLVPKYPTLDDIPKDLENNSKGTSTTTVSSTSGRTNDDTGSNIDHLSAAAEESAAVVANQSTPTSRSIAPMPPPSPATPARGSAVTVPSTTTSQQQNPKKEPVTIEITPGNFVPIRGTDELMDAVMTGRTVSCTCFECSLSLVTIEDADIVICFGCRAISPVELGNTGGGLGLGMRQVDVDEVAAGIIAGLPL